MDQVHLTEKPGTDVLYLNHVLEKFSLDYLCGIFERYGDGRIYEGTCKKTNCDWTRCIFVSYKNPKDMERVLNKKESFPEIFHFDIERRNGSSCMRNILPTGRIIRFKRKGPNHVIRSEEILVMSLADEKEEDEEEKHVTDSVQSLSPISILSDNILGIIFSYLSMRQLIGIERVCKKWREVSLMSWAKANKTLTVRQVLHEKDRKPEILEDLLMRSGKRITSLVLHGDVWRSIGGRKIIDAINKYCKCLTFLYFAFIDLHHGELELISDHVVRNLTSVKIFDCHLTDQWLEQFLKKAINLESLIIYVDDYNEFNGRSLKYLTENCKSITLEDDCRTADTIHCRSLLEKIFENIPHVREICLRSYQPFRLSVLKPIARNITCLTLKFMEDFRKVVSSYGGSSFPNLRFLDFGYSVLDDEGLEFFSNACPFLKKVNISPAYGCPGSRLTPNGYLALMKLENLKHLGVDSKITSEVFETLAVQSYGRFEVVVCYRCNSLSEKSLCRMIELSPKLEKYDVSANKVISLNFLEKALELVNKRTNKIPLTLYVELGKTYYKYAVDESGVRLFAKNLGKNALLNIKFCRYNFSCAKNM